MPGHDDAEMSVLNVQMNSWSRAGAFRKNLLCNLSSSLGLLNDPRFQIYLEYFTAFVGYNELVTFNFQ